MSAFPDVPSTPTAIDQELESIKARIKFLKDLRKTLVKHQKTGPTPLLDMIDDANGHPGAGGNADSDLANELARGTTTTKGRSCPGN